MKDNQFVILNNRDNVAICCSKVSSGETIKLLGASLKVIDDIEIGHKVAIVDIEQGQKIVKYGVPIGSAKNAILAGEHVHMHNMKSDYIPSHTRQAKSDDES